MATTSLLLLLQVFTQTFTADTESRCVAVTYQGVTYKARKATRYRWSGRVSLVMRDRSTLVAPSFYDTVDCDDVCAEKAKKECDGRCKRMNSPSALAASLCYSDQCRKIAAPASCVLDCEKAEKARREAEAERWVTEMKNAKRLPGREIELGGSDTIVNDSSCTCSGSKCVSE